MLHTAVGQRRIGIDHLPHRRLARAQRIGEVGLIGPDSEAGERLHHLVHARVIGNMHSHQVARLFKAPAHGVNAAAAFIAKVLEALLPQRRALIDAERLIRHHRRRGHAIVQRGGINERLDSRTRLTLGLYRAVETVQTEVKAASHRQHAARAGLFDQHAAADAGQDPHRPDIGARRRDCDDIARPHRIGHTGQTRGRTVGKPHLIACQHQADTPVLITHRLVERQQLTLPMGGVDIDMSDGPVPALARRIAQHTRAQGILCRLLQFAIERGTHPEATCINAVRPILGIFAILVDQAAAHFLDKIADRGVIAVHAAGDQAERLRLGGVRGDARRRTILDHLVQHPIAPGNRLVREFGATIGLGRLGQDREERRLMQRQIANILAKIGAGGGLYAKALAAERNFVEVEFKDLRLGQHAFDAAGKDHFLELAPDRIFVANQDVLGYLLRNG